MNRNPLGRFVPAYVYQALQSLDLLDRSLGARLLAAGRSMI